MQRFYDIVETGHNNFYIKDASSKEGLITEKLSELETAIEQRKSEIRNFLPIVPIIGFQSKDLPQNFEMGAPVLDADDSDVNQDDDDQSVADMMNELEDSVESPLSERV